MSEHHTHADAKQEKSGCCGGGKHEPQGQSAPKEEQPKAAPAKRGCCG